jgi:hypothetical protein
LQFDEIAGLSDIGKSTIDELRLKDYVEWKVNGPRADLSLNAEPTRTKINCKIAKSPGAEKDLVLRVVRPRRDLRDDLLGHHVERSMRDRASGCVSS